MTGKAVGRGLGAKPGPMLWVPEEAQGPVLAGVRMQPPAIGAALMANLRGNALGCSPLPPTQEQGPAFFLVWGGKR